MTKHHPTHDYLPAAGRDAYLPFYDLLTIAFGVGTVHRNLIGQARLGTGQRVLEIGCGTGNLSLRAARTYPGAEVLGTDPDPLALARAERKIGGRQGIRFELAYAQELPYADGSFDRVLSSLMLHHLDDEAKTATLTEVARVLRPGGSVHIADFTGEIHGAHGFLSRRMRKAGHVADDIPSFLRAAGLESIEVSTRQHRVIGGVAYYRATARVR
ncbi:MAG TPA: class I SAM-dependent methyltransferase [Pseudonocardiaceae bacterium]